MGIFHQKDVFCIKMDKIEGISMFQLYFVKILQITRISLHFYTFLYFFVDCLFQLKNSHLQVKRWRKDGKRWSKDANAYAI